VLQVLGALLAVVTVATGLAALFGPSDGVSVRTGADAAASDGSSTTSTVELAEVTASTQPPETTAPPPEETVAEPPPTTAAPGEVVTGEGAVLVRPSFSPPRPLVGDCGSLADDGWSVVACDRVAAKGVELIWLIEAQGAEQRGLVLRPATAGAWTVILASGSQAEPWNEIRVKTADVSGDGAADIGFGFRRSGTNVLAVDLVEGPGRVVVHDNLIDGVVRVQLLRLETWERVRPGANPFVHATIRFDAGAYRRQGNNEQVPAGSVPNSDL
jgi:hypothetical protein